MPHRKYRPLESAIRRVRDDAQRRLALAPPVIREKLQLLTEQLTTAAATAEIISIRAGENEEE